MRTEPAIDDRRERRRSTVWARRFLTIGLAGLLVAAVGNVALEVGRDAGARALVVHEGGDLGAATAGERSLSRGRYWIASTIHDVAFGGTLVVPDLATIDWYRFENLADVDVRVEAYDPNLTPEMAGALFGLPTVQGLGNITGRFDFKPFRVVWSPEGTPVAALRLWYFGDMMYLVDDRLIPTEESR